MNLILKIIIPFVIIFGAVAGFKALKASAPEVKSKEPPKVIPEAQITTVTPATHRPPVTTFGTFPSRKNSHARSCDGPH